MYMWNSSEEGIIQGITVCLVSAVLSTMWWPGSFQTVRKDHILVFFNRHCSTMNLVRAKQGRLVPPGLQRWPFKLIKHFADTTRVSPSPAGPAGFHSLNFLNMINLKFRVSALDGCCILYFRPNRSFVCNFLSTPRCKSQVHAKETKCPSCFKRDFWDMLTQIHVVCDGDTKVFCRLNNCVVNRRRKFVCDADAESQWVTFDYIKFHLLIGFPLS